MSNANVFTDEFRAALPTSVKDFLTHHEIKLCFKHEVNPLSDGSKGKTYNNLIKSLGSLCNPIVDNDVVTDQNENDVCYKHYFKQKPTNSRNKHYHKTLWSERGNIKKNRRTMTNKNIGGDYIKDGLNIMLRHKNPDINRDLVMVLDSSSSFKNPEKVVGFLMTALGECNNEQNDFSKVPALNLICAPRKHVHSKRIPECAEGRCSVISRVLLFMYLFALKRKNVKYALLELAGLYCNMKGLCLYNKFGFREDVSLVEDSCFSDDRNLAMICNLDNITEKQLADALITNTPINVPHTEPLCDKSLIKNKDLQRDEVDRRMENYASMLEVQYGNVSLNEAAKYSGIKLPNDRKKAVQKLGLLSKNGAKYKFFFELKPDGLKANKNATKKKANKVKIKAAQTNKHSILAKNSNLIIHTRRRPTEAKKYNFR